MEGESQLGLALAILLCELQLQGLARPLVYRVQPWTGFAMPPSLEHDHGAGTRKITEQYWSLLRE